MAHCSFGQAINSFDILFQSACDIQVEQSDSLSSLRDHLIQQYQYTILK